MLRCSQGDAGVFTFTAFASPGVPMNLTGASILTRIPSIVEGAFVEIENSQHTILDQTNPDTVGQFQVAFTSIQSVQFKFTPDGTPSLEVVSVVAQNGNTTAFHGKNQLRVSRSVPRIT